MQTRFTIDVSYNYRNINLVEKEQQALSAIWDKCCKDDVNATTRAIVNEGNGRRLGLLLSGFQCTDHACRSLDVGNLLLCHQCHTSPNLAGVTSQQSDAVLAAKSLPASA